MQLQKDGVKWEGRMGRFNADPQNNSVQIPGYASGRSQSQIREPPPGFDVNCYSEAVCEGDLSTLQGLVTQFENGEGPGKVLYSALKRSDGSNALHWAADLGKTSTCRFLIEKLKFDINGTTNKGETPLHRAILANHRPTIIFIISNGADVNKCTISREAPLHFVAQGGTKELVKLLVSKGADIHATSNRGMPLHYAAGAGNHDALQCLLDLKAEPNPTSVDMSPLAIALTSNSHACLDLLLKAGADPNRPCQQSEPLRYAASVLDGRVIRRLLKAGANPNTPGFDGHTPLEHAALFGRLEVVKLLFPVTSRNIGCYPDWSIRGIMKHAQSEETIALVRSKWKEFAQIAKTKGRDAFEGKRYLDAINWYNQAVQIDPTDAKALFNRSLCYTNLNWDSLALVDAQNCIEHEPCWPKAHYREGAAWKALKDFKKAAEAFYRALALDPGNKEIEKALSEVLALAGLKGMQAKKPTVEYSLPKYYA